MKALFEIGQKVVCVDSKNSTGLIEGKKYTIYGMVELACCGNIVLNVGLKVNKYIAACPCGVKNNYVGWRSQTRFIPLEFDRQADEEIKTALNEGLKIKNL